MSCIKLQTIDYDLLPAVLELDRICFGGLWSLEGYQREVDSPNSELIAIVQDQTLIGYGCFWAILDEAHITIIAVHPNHQRQGLGHLLLYALLDRARQRGMERATLEVRISNQSAISLYEKYGFKTAGQRKKYYADTGEDALILWRSGLQSVEFETLMKTWEDQISDRLKKYHWMLKNPENINSPNAANLDFSLRLQ